MIGVPITEMEQVLKQRAAINKKIKAKVCALTKLCFAPAVVRKLPNKN